jgi:hypothetical protein
VVLVGIVLATMIVVRIVLVPEIGGTLLAAVVLVCIACVV